MVGKLRKVMVGSLVIPLLLSTLLISATTSAPADRVQEKKNQLQQIKAEVQAIDARLETVVEQYNLTNLRVEQTRAAIRANESRIASLNAQIKERQGILGSRLRELYMNGNTEVIEVITDCKTVDDFISNVGLIKRISDRDIEIIKSVNEAREGLQAANQELEIKKAELQADLEEVARQKAAIEADLARRKQLMAGVEAEINRLIREEEEQLAQQRNAYNPPSYRPPAYTPPPPNPNAPAVVKVAYAQLGKPYRYGAAGPDMFDCSGLTMYCYAQVGIYIPHSSYAQMNCGPRVAYEDLEPGDLVFFRGGGHVGMYIGNGQYIHAPHTGDVVRIANLSSRSDLCGACRPLARR
jgi:cell wall-associated NlpC family hydrolase